MKTHSIWKKKYYHHIIFYKVCCHFIANFNCCWIQNRSHYKVNLTFRLTCFIKCAFIQQMMCLCFVFFFHNDYFSLLLMANYLVALLLSAYRLIGMFLGALSCWDPPPQKKINYTHCLETFKPIESYLIIHVRGLNRFISVLYILKMKIDT